MSSASLFYSVPDTRAALCADYIYAKSCKYHGGTAVQSNQEMDEFYKESLRRQKENNDILYGPQKEQYKKQDRLFKELEKAAIRDLENQNKQPPPSYKSRRLPGLDPNRYQTPQPPPVTATPANSQTNGEALLTVLGFVAMPLLIASDQDRASLYFDGLSQEALLLFGFLWLGLFLYAAYVAFQKRQIIWFVIGFFWPWSWVIGSFCKAKPGSPWYFKKLKSDGASLVTDPNAVSPKNPPSSNTSTGAKTMRPGAGVAAPPHPPKGWFPDPLNPERLRWWDGSSWTDNIHPK